MILMILLMAGSNVMAQVFDVRNQAEWDKIVLAGATVERLVEGLKFTEGPAWSDQDGGSLLYSDIPANRIYKYTPGQGNEIWREPSDNSNGQTRDPQGRLISCHHGTRVVTRTNADGSIEVVADKYDGKRFNSPNDVIAKSDGTLWFTDPPYGLPKGTVGKELDKNYVFRIDGDGKVTPVANDFHRPNGLCFSPDESKIYIANSDTDDAHIRVFVVAQDNTLSGGEIFCKIDAGVPDGIRTDRDGRLYSSAGDGVQIFSPTGELIGKIHMPQVTVTNDKGESKQVQESPANLRFGGKDRKTLYLTAKTSLYSIQLLTAGAD